MSRPIFFFCEWVAESQREDMTYSQPQLVDNWTKMQNFQLKHFPPLWACYLIWEVKSLG